MNLHRPRHLAIVLTATLTISACDRPEPSDPPDRSAPDTPASSPTITFLAEADDHTRALDLDTLQATLPVETITLDELYYEKEKTFLAIPLSEFIAAGFDLPPEELQTRDFLLRAADGFAVAVHGTRLFEPGGFAAIDDLDHDDGWELIGTMDVDPAPVYVVWTGEDQQNVDTHPRPWQLVEISIVHPDEIYANASPPTDASPDAHAGYTLFRRDCIVCHAVNRSGGRAGPEMNIPQNITEYRDRDFLLAYTRDPGTFRYSQMPAFPHLTDQDLDQLYAYLLAMKDRKIDP